MLLNNFKSLLTWNTTDTFINTAGETVSKQEMLVGSVYGSLNNHISVGTISYNYNTTTAVSNYIDEQTAYHFNGIVQNLSTSSPESYHKNNGLILFVGNGSSEVTPNDYKLGNAIALASTGGSCIHNNNVTTVIRTFHNDTEENVTINEIGLYVFHSLSTYQSKYLSYPVLIGRKILDVPVTIAPNELYTFTYQIIMDGFTFTEAN